MTFRQKLACNVSPIFLRLLLAVVFMWAGLGKVLERDVEVTPTNAQRLVDWGAVAQAEVEHLLPQQGADATDPTAPRVHLAMQTTDADPQPVKVLRLYGLALGVHNSSYPTTRPDGTQAMQLLPDFAGQGKTPVYLAWACALTEIFAGGFMLLGFLTRISALAIFGVMCVASWMTVFGPAVQSGRAKLGFLPPDYPTFGMEWQNLIVQASMALVALAVLFSGAGAASLDRLLFGGGGGGAPDKKAPPAA